MIYTFSPKKHLYIKTLFVFTLCLIFGIFVHLIDRQYQQRYISQQHKNKNDTNLTLQTELRSKSLAILESKEIIDNNILGIQSASYAKTIPVLLYHGIVNTPDGVGVHVEDFITQMYKLKQNGWNTITLQDFYKFLKNEKKIPKKSFVLTFDDGRKDSYYPVDPVLKKLNYTASIFIISGYTGKNNFHLNDAELQEMTKSGRWEIESHANLGHKDIVIDDKGNKGRFLGNPEYIVSKSKIESIEEYTNRISTDLSQVKSIVSNYNPNTNFFAFPFNDYGQKSIEEVQDKFKVIASNLFKIGFIQDQIKNSYVNYPDNFDFYATRINVDASMSNDSLISTMEGLVDIDLPFTLDNSNVKKWNKIWGGVDIENGKFITFANNTTGSQIILNGTNNWTNYKLISELEFIKGQTFSIIVNYIDQNNYVDCQYSKDGIAINEYKNSIKTTHFKKYNSNYSLNRNRKYIVELNSRGLTCTIGNITGWVDTKAVNSKTHSGRIGFKTWDPLVNNTKLIINSIDVVPLEN